MVVEAKTPHNMKTIKPSEVKIKEYHPTEPQTWRAFLDREFTATLRVIKKDSDTKQTVIEMCIRDRENTDSRYWKLDNRHYAGNQQVTG